MLLGLLAPAAGAAPATRPRVLLVGDSLLVEAAPHVRALAERSAVDVHVAAWPGTAICDWVAPMAELRRRVRPDVVVLAFVGNDLTPCVKDRPRGLGGASLGLRYYRDIEAMSAQLRGLEVRWVVPPARRWWHRAASAVTAAYTDAARWRDDVHLLDGRVLISPGGRWAATQPCLPEEPCTGPRVGGVRHNVVRGPDGLHFCPTSRRFTAECDTYASGAYRYARAILLPVARELASNT